MLNITSENFEKEVLSSSVPVVVDFFATWCGPCKMLSPIVEELADEYGEKLRFGKVNVDDERELALKFGISSIPTLLFFREGKLVKSIVGYRDKNQLKEITDALI